MTENSNVPIKKRPITFEGFIGLLVAEANKQNIQNFVLDEIDFEVYEKLYAYFFEVQNLCEKYKIDTKKGLLIMGRVGVGKTTIMRLIRKILDRGEKGFLILHTNDIVRRYNIEGSHLLTQFGNLPFKKMCLEDLGSEPIGRHYGNPCNTLQEILLARYRLKEEFPGEMIVTHATTNLDAKSIEALYGKRVRSRMKAMFNMVAFSKESKDKRG